MKLLIVEDDERVARALKTAFYMEYIAADVAEDGERGLFLSLVNEYDVVILDNNLPKKSGVELCRELRARKNGVRIVMLSVADDIETKVAALDGGADDYLAKPFAFTELLARVRAVVRRPVEVMDEKRLQVGDLTMQCDAGRVYKAGKEVVLTRKEFMVLELLMRNQGKVISRGDALERIWETDVDPFTNTVEVHIANIRKKLGTSEEGFIRTVYGRGYVLE